jgi:hypothetical protein
MDEKAHKESLLKLMRFWLFGTFVVVFAAVTAYIGIFVSWSQAVSHGLPIWGITAVVCVIWYFAYQWYLNRKKA